MIVDLYQHQADAVKNIKNGSVVKGGVGSGKSRTSLAYAYDNYINVKEPKNLYIITTARKRDTHDWEEE